MADNKFTIELGAGLTQMGTNNFPLMRAKDIEYNDGRLTDFMPVYVTKEEYDELVASGNVQKNVPYFIYRNWSIDDLINDGHDGAGDV